MIRRSTGPCVAVEALDVTSESRAKDELKAALDGTLLALSRAIELRDPYTAGHQRNVSLLSEAIAKRMQLDCQRVEAVRVAGGIHDVGKIAVLAENLCRPGPLSLGERLVLEQDPIGGYEALRNVVLPWSIDRIVLEHHDRIDGLGYPHGVSGGDILMESRILAIADILDALQNRRPYRSASSAEIAVKEIRREAGISLDAAVVSACCEVLECGVFTLEF